MGVETGDSTGGGLQAGGSGGCRPARSPEQAASRRATWGAVGSVLLWCWSGVCFAQGARIGGSMVYLTLMTATGAGTVVVLQYCQGRPLGDLARIQPRVAVAGFWGVAFYTVILALAFGLAPDADIGQVNLLNYLWPVWIALLSILMLPDRPRVLPALAGALLGFAGVVVTRGLATFTRSPSGLLPHGLALLGGFLWAVYCVLLRRWKVPEEEGGTAVHFAVCSLLAGVVGLYRGEWRGALPFSPRLLFWVFFGGVGPVGLAYHWWEIGVKRGDLGLISLLAYFIPVGSSVLIGLFFRESMSRGLVPGAAMIALGAVIVGHSSTRTADRGPPAGEGETVWTPPRE